MAKRVSALPSVFRLVLLLPLFLILAFRSSVASARLIDVPGDIPFAIRFAQGSVATIRSWIKNGAKTRIKIHVNYAAEFQFPEEAKCEMEEDDAAMWPDAVDDAEDEREEEEKTRVAETGASTSRRGENDLNSTTTASDGNRSRETSGFRMTNGRDETKVDIRHSQIIFDWCHWEWSLRGRRGIWDTDFRFETYSLGLMLLADTAINVRVNFSESAYPYDRRYFVECLSKPEQLQEVGRAMKWAMDEFITSEEAKSEKTALPSPPPPPPMSGRELNTTELCRRQLWETPKKFGSGLKKKSYMCFHAVRPANFSRLRYLDTKDKQTTFSDTDYAVTDVCLCGKGELQDSRTLKTKEAAGGFFKAVFAFRIIFIVVVAVNLPFIVFKLYPESDPREDDGENESASRATEGETDDARMEGRNGATANGVDASFRMTIVNATENDTLLHQREGEEREGGRIGEGREREKDEMDSRISACCLVDDGGKKEESYSILEDPMPSLNPLSILTSEVKCCGVIGNLTWEWMRRFLLFFLFSTHIILVAVIIDERLHRTTISKLIAFMYENNVTVSDLRFWNHLCYGYWANAQGVLSLIWLAFLAVFSHPKMKRREIDYVQPSTHFGTLDLKELHLLPASFLDMKNGLKKVRRAMVLRMGLFYRIPFWREVCKSFSNPEITLRERVTNFFINLVACLSFFPIVAPLIPWMIMAKNLFCFRLCGEVETGGGEVETGGGEVETGGGEVETGGGEVETGGGEVKTGGGEVETGGGEVETGGGEVEIGGGDNPHWNVRLATFAFLTAFFVLAGFLVYQSIFIYSMLIVFTLTSAIFHYQQSLNVIGVVAGCVIFFLNIRSKVKNKYASLNLSVAEVAKDVDEERTKGMTEARRQSVSKLVTLSSAGLPLIPRRLYRDIVLEIHPIGPERAKMLVKLAAMTVFVIYIHTVMRALRMTEEDAAFDMAQAIVTVVAVVVPSIVANLRSGVEKELEKERHKCFIRKMMDKFVEENGYYE